MKALSVVLLSLVASAAMAAGPDEAMIRQAVADAQTAIEEGDFAAWARYFTEQSDITMDMDPLPERGQRQLDYATFMKVGSLGIQGLENPVVTQTIESLQPDPESDAMVLVLVTRVESDLLGMRMEEVTRSETRYGLKDGQLQVEAYSEEVLSSGPVKP